MACIMAKYVESHMIAFWLSFLVLLVCDECTKNDVKDIKKDLISSPCPTYCLQIPPLYCCCSDKSSCYTAMNSCIGPCKKRGVCCPSKT
ncbi:unnamed protein product [Lactuca virosa]|uniref:Uncharacterized protein n=1 Tax=Lactuca virosa TaxID=75947 RepID=A0AAU9LY36_9ASTR|nr:unnamed protein product [Lactuca virosa]